MQSLAHTRPQGKECMLFAGSAVASGAGTGLVTSIGMATEIGKIQSDIQVRQTPRRGCKCTQGLCAGTPSSSPPLADARPLCRHCLPTQRHT